MAAWCSGKTGLDQRSCATSGTVTTWIGDRLLALADKPSRLVLSRPTQPPISTQLSIPLYVNRVPACLAGVTAGCVHLCRVEGALVWQATPRSSEMTCSGEQIN